jgi:hypothetical protein
MNADEAQAVQLTGGAQLLIPFGQDAHLVWTRTNGQTAAVGLVRQGNKTLNVGASGQERVVRVLSAQKAEKLVRKLREKSKFQEFEGKLAQKGKRVGKVRVLLDETNKVAILGIAAEGDEKKIAHQVRIKVKADKEDEPEDDAEPAIQATACGQATGEAVPTGARMQPLRLDAEDGGAITTGSYTLIERDYGPQICTSQWGYDYLCTSTTPMLRLSLSRLAPTLTLPPTFIDQPVQASFTIWNGGGGRLTGTVSAPAPFSIVSGASFSLLPGQPQEVVVRFSSGTAGSFSKSIAISSNGGNATVTATAVAHKVSFSPASVDFGSGLLVLREQCDSMGGCGLRTEKVGLPIEKALTVKNEGTVSVTLTLSTAAPYKIVSVLPTLSPGQSAQVTLRFDPTESGTFTGNVQVGINGGQGSVTAPLVGTAHKIEIEPAELNFGLVFIGSSRARKLTVKNQGVTTVALTVSTGGPYSLESPSSFTLVPSQSRDVVVRFIPPNSSVFSSNIRLTAGSNAIDVPVVGRAMTREEYIQQAVIAYNAAVQQGGYGAMYVQDGNRGLALAGFPSLSADEVTGFLGMFDQLSSPEGGEIPPEVAQALEILSSIGEEQLEEWLWALVLAERAGQFEQEYERLLDLGFDSYIQALQLVSGMTSEQVKITLHHFINQLALKEGDNWESAFQSFLALEQDTISIWGMAFDIYKDYINSFGLPLPIGVAEALAAFFAQVFATTYELAWARLSYWERLDFEQDIKTILRYLKGMADKQKAGELLIALREVLEKVRNSVIKDQYKALIKVLARAVGTYGWDLEDIEKILTVRDPRSGKEKKILVQLVLRQRHYWLEQSQMYVDALFLIEFYNCLGACDVTARDFILGWVGDIVNNLDQILRSYGAEFGIVGVVIVDRTEGSGAYGMEKLLNTLQNAYGESNVAIFVVWTDSSGQIWFSCIGKGCSQMTSSQRKREACMLAGRWPGSGCGAREWIIKKGELPPPPDDDKGPVKLTP